MVAAAPPVNASASPSVSASACQAPAALDELLDPSGYLGSAGAFVERALAAYEREETA